MARLIFLLYGIIAYLLFLASFGYAIGFVSNLVVPKTLDGEATVSLTEALLIDMTVLAIFALQHSIMARRSFKTWWTKIIPEPIERSTYTLLSSICLIAIIYFWQPIGIVIWNVETETAGKILTWAGLAGWALVVISTFAINHFDLFGLRQVWLYCKKKPYTALRFNTPNLYQHVRHPLYLGFILAFWLTPVMTVAHLVFAILCTGYILVGIFLEEKDLVSDFGEQYKAYRKKVPMLIPFLKKKK